MNVRRTDPESSQETARMKRDRFWLLSTVFEFNRKGTPITDNSLHRAHPDQQRNVIARRRRDLEGAGFIIRITNYNGEDVRVSDPDSPRKILSFKLAYDKGTNAYLKWLQGRHVDGN